MGHGSTFLDIARVHGRRGLEQQDVNFLFCDGPVLDATWHDQELSLLQPNLTIAEVHAEAAVDDEEQLVLMLVVMPDELALEFDQFDLLPVERTDNLRIPVIGKQSQLFPQVDLFHTLVLEFGVCARSEFGLTPPGLEGVGTVAVDEISVLLPLGAVAFVHRRQCEEFEIFVELCEGLR